jgi:hypothetical protein
MDQQNSFFRSWVFVTMAIVMVIFGAWVGITAQALRIKGKSQRFISQAKLVSDSDNISYGNRYQDYMPPDFYSAVIDTVKSSELRRRAFERLQISTCDMNRIAVEVRVAQEKGSRVFTVRAFSSDPKFTRRFLDALLDECVAFYEKSRQQSKGDSPAIKVSERASPSVVDNEEWIRATAIGAASGGLAGLFVSFAIGKLIIIASKHKPTPP